MRNFLSLSLALSLSTSLVACTTDEAPTPASSTSLPTEFASVAKAHIAQIFAAGLAPSWTDATLGNVLTLESPGVDGIAYYDVDVLVGDAPAGHIVISASGKEQRVVSFATEGRAPIAELADRA